MLVGERFNALLRKQEEHRLQDLERERTALRQHVRFCAPPEFVVAGCLQKVVTVPSKAHGQNANGAAGRGHFSFTANQAGLVHQKQVVLDLELRVPLDGGALLRTVVRFCLEVQRELSDKVEISFHVEEPRGRHYSLPLEGRQGRPHAIWSRSASTARAWRLRNRLAPQTQSRGTRADLPVRDHANLPGDLTFHLVFRRSFSGP